ncbi:hypothetical protein [Microcoleus sp. AR_TQ3_B6]|uniref:hypothetical protein n=1 Tax=Microcoleus sp. AR_TQ3_B6 TaxID=3055284 RepID=UPI002FD0079F
MTKTAKQRGANIRIVGTKSQISELLAAFRAKDFTWQSNEHFYARRDEPGLYSYYVENFECVQQCKGSVEE